MLNLQKAQAMGRPVLTACASCYARLRTANHKVRNEPDERQRAERVTGKPYDGSVEVHHVLDVLVNRLGLDGIRAEGAAAAGRAARGVLLRLPAHPAAGGRGLRQSGASRRAWTIWSAALGAEPVAWPYKTECCGASLSITQSEVVGRLGRKLLSMARQAGAECIVVACPLCQLNLDLRQSDAAQGPRANCPPRRSCTSRSFWALPWDFRPRNWGWTR